MVRKLVILGALVAVAPACNKKDDASPTPATSATTAASAAGSEGRRDREHGWDGGRDHEEHPH